MNRDGDAAKKNLARETMSDHELLRAYADRSDMGCLGVFVSRHQEPLLRYASSIVGDDEEAQDVVQETLVQVLKRPRRLLGVDSCRNWMLRVAHNIGVDHLRRQVRHRRHVERLGQSQDGREAASRDPLEAAEERERVRSEIRALVPSHREVLLLKIEHGKSYREISEITGLSVPNVGYRLHEAVKALARRLRRKDAP